MRDAFTIGTSSDEHSTSTGPSSYSPPRPCRSRAAASGVGRRSELPWLLHAAFVVLVSVLIGLAAAAAFGGSFTDSEVPALAIAFDSFLLPFLLLGFASAVLVVLRRVLF